MCKVAGVIREVCKGRLPLEGFHAQAQQMCDAV